ncbi:hypothetical protein [Nonomuraea cavernae]|uniref:Uncharacterized protein n=1 Tax=Nonomuraea cavernae TaxID=2045107 RepID=A0A918DJ74_9ACTN|nr:hypothetical protein [Nonomuraea cavernae]MCA2187243.1 hypothetical protein [Nonomuraea cavernae]GGO68016.1 hypothetical protein GCM10012289_25800 [Nonomuraea cavernae]
MAERIGYQTHHFSLANPQGEGQEDVPTLLRRVADTLDGLGAIEIRDLILHTDLDDEGTSWPSVTVYFDYDEENPPGDDMTGG